MRRPSTPSIRTCETVRIIGPSLFRSCQGAIWLARSPKWAHKSLNGESETVFGGAIKVCLVAREPLLNTRQSIPIGSIQFQREPPIRMPQPAALVGITAHLGLFAKGEFRAEETLFVRGGTGGVGSMVVQMAHAMGGKVITTAGSDSKGQRCRDLGTTM